MYKLSVICFLVSSSCIDRAFSLVSIANTFTCPTYPHTLLSARPCSLCRVHSISSFRLMEDAISTSPSHPINLAHVQCMNVHVCMCVCVYDCMRVCFFFQFHRVAWRSKSQSQSRVYLVFVFLRRQLVTLQFGMRRLLALFNTCCNTRTHACMCMCSMYVCICLYAVCKTNPANSVKRRF